MSWLTKAIGVDKVIETKLNDIILGQTMPYQTQVHALLEYRAREYKAWASGNPDNLLTFYKHTIEPSVYSINRLMFWSWVGGINVPKMHYPSTEIILNYIRGIVFSGDVKIEPTKKGASETDIESMTERIEAMKKDINFDDFVANGSTYETYSGSLGFKFVIDTEVHDKPIIELYPKERLEVITKYGKTQQIIFKDEYYRQNKLYTLLSIYGKGYIDYKLYRDKKEVNLSELEETKNLQRFEFNPKIILATWKKNKPVSSEFSELPYGGSDFEGGTDIFHSIDEIFSTMMLYIRRNRPIMGVDESLLPVNENGSQTITPREFQFDMIKFRNNDTNKDKIYRDNPEIKTESYLTSIKDLMLSIYQKIGMSYVTVSDSGIGANASGDSIDKREKSTTTMRDTKIKGWVHTLDEVTRIYLICEDLIENHIITRDYKDWDFLAVFPEYNGQTFSERLDDIVKAKNIGIMDTKTAVERVYGEDYDDETKKKIVLNAKLENGETLLESDVQIE